MFYISRNGGYLKILTDDEVKDFADISFGEQFKSTKTFLKLCEEQNIRKVAELLYIFRTTTNKVENYVEMMKSNSSDNCVHNCNIKVLNLFDPELQLSK